jgi:hypothetical protein
MSMAFVAKKEVWHRWFLPLGVCWMFLNLFDLGITLWAIEARVATEANRLMALVIHHPIPAALTKLGLTYLALKMAERIELKSRFSSVPVLVMMDVYLLLANISNVMTCFGSSAPTWFHRFFPLA